MQKLISTQNEVKSTKSEDHYIIDNILENLLNKEVSALFLQANACLDNEDFSESLQYYDLILNQKSKYRYFLRV